MTDDGGFMFERAFSPVRERAANALIARRGFEPLEPSLKALKRIPAGSLVSGRLGIA
jgi:hypothetical protein